MIYLYGVVDYQINQSALIIIEEERKELIVEFYIFCPWKV